MDRVLPPYPPKRSASAQRQLEHLGVTVRTNTRVVGIDEHGVDVEQEGQRSRVPARTVLWAAGVLASSFARHAAATLGAVTDRSGRVVVNGELNPPDHPDVFFIGDAARMEWKDDRIVPGVAQGAIQSGRYAARTIRHRLHGQAVEPFHYRDRGDVAIIGRLSGVTNIPWLGPFGQAGGLAAWMLWLGIHLVYLIGYANRVVVLTRWGWSFVTHGRGSRLITGQPLLPELEEPIEEAGDHVAAHTAGQR
jgi:NADH dehydrogenase